MNLCETALADELFCYTQCYFENQAKPLLQSKHNARMNIK